MAAFAVGSVLRLRGEESSGSGLAVTGAGALVLLGAAGSSGGLSAAAVSGDPGAVGRQLGAALVQWPAVLVVAGLTAVLVGLVPRLSALAWILGARAAAEDLDVVPLIGLAVGAGALAAVALTAFRRRHLTA